MGAVAVLVFSACVAFPDHDSCNSSIKPAYYTPEQCNALIPVVSAGFVNGISEHGGIVFWMDVHCAIVKGDGA